MRLAFVILYIVISTVLIGFLGYKYFSNILYLANNGILLWTVTVGFVLLVSLIVYISATVRYQIPKPNTALIDTNKPKNNIAFAGGLWVNTIFHKIREIPLNTMRLDIFGDSILTNNFRRCDLEVTFFLRIIPDEVDIHKASQFFDEKPITPKTLQMCLESKLVGILRSVVAEIDSYNITHDRKKFINQISDTCKDELKTQYGFTLEHTYINHVILLPEDKTNVCTSFGVIIDDDVWEQTVQCDICGTTDCFNGLISKSFGKGETLLIIEDVPVIICKNCRKSYATRETLQKIEVIKRDHENVAQKRSVPVAVFK